MECWCIVAALNQDCELVAASILAVHRDLLCQCFCRVQGIDLRITVSTVELIGPSSIGLDDQSAVAAVNRFIDEKAFIPIGVHNIQLSGYTPAEILNGSLLGSIGEDGGV